MKFLARDTIAGALVAVVCVVVFGYHSDRLGFYADDSMFLAGIYPGMPIQDLLHGIGIYVTGRNLHILWQYLVTVAAGGNNVDHVPAMHFVQVAADTAASLLLFAALRLWGVTRAAAFFTAVAFSLFPNHGETHFWLSSLPMNIVSTIFVLILLCLSALLLRASAANDRTSIIWLGLLLVVSFLCSMFTYDQTVPVTMVIVTLLSAAIFYQDRKLRVIAAAFWCFCLAVFAALLVWKVEVPAGGPVFSNLTIDHLLESFILSLHIWSPLASAFVHPFGAANGTEKMLAVLVSASVVVIYFLLRQPEIAGIGRPNDRTIKSNQSGAWPRSLALIAAGAAFYVLAYLPAYLWYLSPRHTYLPSVGIAFMLAGVFGLAAPLIERHFSFKLGALIFMGLMLTSFVSQNLIEKEFWISAYTLRADLYRRMGDQYASRNPTNLLLSGFPSDPAPGSPSLAFLAGEQPYAAWIVTKGKIKADRMTLHPVPSNDGYFIRTEIARWPDEALLHIPKEDATVVLFEGLRYPHLNFLYDIGRDKFTSDAFYKLTPVEGSDAINALSARRGPAGGYDVGVPSVSVKPDEALALVGCIRDGARLSPALYAIKTDPEQFQIPVDVSADRTGKAHAFHLDYNVSMPEINGFRLYVVNKEKARLIGETVLK